MFRGNFIVRIHLTILLLFFLSSCNHREEVPFPETENFVPNPTSQAIHFTDPITLNLEGSIKQVHPTYRKFDVHNLIPRKLGPSEFRPFAKKPDTASFRWDQLEDSVFDEDKIPSRPLVYETSILPVPKPVRVGRFRPDFQNPSYQALFPEPLSGTHIYKAVSDHYGLMWISAENGLYRYDGETLSLFLAPPKSWTAGDLYIDSLNRVVFTVSQSKTGNLDGLMILDPSKFTLKHFDSEKLGLNTGAFIADAGPNGEIWITGSDSKIAILNEKAGWYKAFDIYSDGKIIRPLMCILDKDSNVWISTLYHGLRIINRKSGRIIIIDHTHGMSTDTVASITFDKNGKIWIGSLNEKINLIDPSSRIITHYGKEQGLLPALHLGGLEDRQGNIWFNAFFNHGDTTELTVINPYTESLKTIFLGRNQNWTAAESVSMDMQGQIWIASTQGLMVTQPSKFQISRYGTEDVTSIAEDNGGRIWSACPKIGFTIFDHSNSTLKLLNTSNGLLNNDLNDVKDYNGNLYITYVNTGFDVLDSNLRQFTHYSKAVGLRVDSSLRLWADRNKKILMGSVKMSGIDILDQSNQTVQQIGLLQGLKDSAIEVAKQDQNGLIWFNTKRSRTGVLDLTHRTLRFLKDTTDDIAPNSSYAYKLMLVDPKNYLWMATNRGIVVINPQRDSLIMINTNSGLPAAKINSLHLRDCSLYVGSESGLSIVSPPWLSHKRGWQIQSYGEQYLLGKNLGYYDANLLANDGTFYWGDKGVTRFAGLSAKPGPSPATFISGMNIFDQPMSFANDPWTSVSKGDTLRDNNYHRIYLHGQLPSNTIFSYKNKSSWDSISGPNNLPQNLILPYNRNYIQFHFSQANMVRLDTVWYRYMLEGVDKKWSDKTADPFSQNYLNLPPGEYNFKVSSLYGNTWSEPTNFSFTIATPWWKTWWAWTFYILCAAIAGRFYVRFRSRKLIALNSMLEHRVKQRTAELSKSLEDLKQTQTQLVQSEKMASLGELTAGIAHEIQNPLNFINNFSEVNSELIDELNEALRSGNTEEAISIANNVKQNFDRVSEHGKRADTIVKSMLQHSRTSTGQKELTDINALTDEYLKLSYHGMRAKDKSFNANFKTDFDSSLPLINVIPQDLGRVVLNLFNNAFYAVNLASKKNGKDFDPAVFVSTRKISSGVEIRIKDNGGGIPAKITDKVFQPFFTTKPTGQGTGLGLSLSYDLVSAQGGKLKLENYEHQGAEFIITLPGT